MPTLRTISHSGHEENEVSHEELAKIMTVDKSNMYHVSDPDDSSKGHIITPEEVRADAEKPEEKQKIDIVTKSAPYRGG